MNLTEYKQKIVEEQATGCVGVHGYASYARSHGYTHCEVYDWTSSAGDWTFLVSKDGTEWHIMSQENNWPRPGFSYHIDERPFFGTFEDACETVEWFYSGGL